MRPKTYEDVIDFALELEEGTKTRRKDTKEGTFNVNGEKNKKPNTPKKYTKRDYKEKSEKIMCYYCNKLGTHIPKDSPEREHRVASEVSWTWLRVKDCDEDFVKIRTCIDTGSVITLVDSGVIKDLYRK